MKSTLVLNLFRCEGSLVGGYATDAEKLAAGVAVDGLRDMFAVDYSIHYHGEYKFHMEDERAMRMRNKAVRDFAKLLLAFAAGDIKSYGIPAWVSQPTRELLTSYGKRIVSI